ncbi:MAG: ROK family protein [Terracidiphilus sp.]
MITDHPVCILVYDVGGSHVSAALCFDGDYRLGPTLSAGHPQKQSSDAFVDVLYSLGRQASAGLCDIPGAELAMPGPFDYATGVSWMRHKLPYLYGVSLREALAARFDWQAGQVCFLNDAAAHLLGEIGAGAARGVRRAVGITLGTGIGSAFALDGRVVTEGTGVPPGGEIWNLPYEDRTVEDFISTRSLQQAYRQRTGRDLEVAAIAAAAKNDPAAASVFTQFGRQLGLALRSLLSAFAPDVVVLGGGISRSSHLFLDAAQDQLKGLPIELRVSTLGAHAPLVGAGVAWFTGSTESVEPACEAVQADVL